MTLPFGRQFSLFPRGEAGLTCDEAGLALGAIPIAIVTEDATGRRRCRARPFAEIAKALELAYGSTLDRSSDYYCAGLQRLAELIEDGDRGRAALYAVLLGLPQISSEGMAKLANSEDLRKAGDSWRWQPRLPEGERARGSGRMGEARMKRHWSRRRCASIRLRPERLRS